MTQSGLPSSFVQSAIMLSDPQGPSVLAGAVNWVAGTMLGTVATSLAILCVAAIGLMMLTGRVNLRQAASVIFGCFILFGAPTLAAALLGIASADYAAPHRPIVPPPVEPVAVAPPVSPANGYDPYAGASVPVD